MINETEKNMRLAGGAVSFQANHAVDELGALRYVSSGQSAHLHMLTHKKFNMQNHLF